MDPFVSDFVLIDLGISITKIYYLLPIIMYHVCKKDILTVTGHINDRFSIKLSDHDLL